MVVYHLRLVFSHQPDDFLLNYKNMWLWSLFCFSFVQVLLRNNNSNWIQKMTRLGTVWLWCPVPCPFPAMWKETPHTATRSSATPGSETRHPDNTHILQKWDAYISKNILSIVGLCHRINMWSMWMWMAFQFQTAINAMVITHRTAAAFM